jgi:hypothetical protein
MKWKVIIDKLNRSNSVRIVADQDQPARNQAQDGSVHRFATIDEAVEYARVLSQVSGIRHIRIHHSS